MQGHTYSSIILDDPMAVLETKMSHTVITPATEIEFDEDRLLIRSACGHGRFTGDPKELFLGRNGHDTQVLLNVCPVCSLNASRDALWNN